MARNIPAPLQALLDSGATTLCYCWELERQDGMIFGFTDHDADVLVAGVNHLASTSFTAAALQDQLGLAVSSTEVVGGLSSDAITEDDIASTRYDQATYTVRLVNWADPTMFAVLQSGTLGRINTGDIAFQTELRSLAQHFAQYIGSLVSPRCRVVTFGGGGSGLEAGCQADVAGTVRSAVVASVTDRATFSIVPIGGMPADGTGGTLAGGFYAFGSAKFTSGNNNGIAKEIQSHTNGIDFVLKEPFALDIQVGDTLTLTADCDRTQPVCRYNWDQIVNRRAEDYVPGTDQVFRVRT